MNKSLSMSGPVIISLLSLALLSCMNLPDEQGSSRVFVNTDGKEIIFYEQQLIVVRGRLDKNYLNTENSGLSIYNQDYVKDYLAINELVLSSKNCTGKDVTKILSIEKFDPDKHQHAKAGNYKPYTIDEIWAVSSCDLKRLYRVYDMQNSKYVGIYPILDGE